MDIYNLVSFCGLFIFMFLGWLFSANRRILRAYPNKPEQRNVIMAQTK